jgi:hypothetical protein
MLGHIDTLPRRDSIVIPRYGARICGLVLLAALGVVAILLVLLRGYPVVWLFDPHGDFSVFYGAARASLHGRDPYTVPLYHYLPALALLLRPLGLLAQDHAYVVWEAFLILCQAGAITLLTYQYGRRAIIGALALSPALALAIMVAQPVALVILALAGAMVALGRERFVLAGVLLAAAWLKPQVALPAVCLFVLWRPRVAIGFGLGSVGLLACPPLPAWLRHLGAFDVEHERVQASLAGLWPRLFGPHHPGFLLVIGGALLASLLVQRRKQPPTSALAVLLLIWFIAAPYSHAYDTAVLIVPLAVLGTLPSVVLIDCWLAAALSFYSLSTAVIVAPLLLLVYASLTLAPGLILLRRPSTNASRPAPRGRERVPVARRHRRG